MYLGLFVVVFLVWAWLTASSIAAARRNWTNGAVATGSVLVWTGLAGAAILFIGPYWVVVYLVLLQPG